MSGTTELTLYPPHPLAEAFPHATAEEAADLLESVRKNGVRRAIVLAVDEADGVTKVLDGRHRQAVCMELGIECPAEDLPAGTDPVDYVIDMNAIGRHMTPRERAKAIWRCYDLAGGVRDDASDTDDTEQADPPPPAEPAEPAEPGTETRGSLGPPGFIPDPATNTGKAPLDRSTESDPEPAPETVTEPPAAPTFTEQQQAPVEEATVEVQAVDQDGGAPEHEAEQPAPARRVPTNQEVADKAGVGVSTAKRARAEVDAEQRGEEPAPEQAPERRGSSLHQTIRDLRQHLGKERATVVARERRIADLERQVEALERAADPQARDGVQVIRGVQKENEILRVRNMELQQQLNDAKDDKRALARRLKHLES